VITLHTQGDSVIRVGDREVRPTSPVMFAALLYLGVERGQRASRAALQELLFPGGDERSGAHSLRQLLYKLRQLGAPIQSEGDVVWIESGDVVDAPPATNGNGAQHAPYFAPGFAPRLSPEFDEWLERQRASVGTAARRALIARMTARREAADWPTVERLAAEILRSDAFNEEATLALAEATALAGSKTEAIRILERYESETGRSDLKLPAATLRRRISEKLPEQRRHRLDTPFLGRDPEMEAMRQALGRLRQGQPGTVVIAGEAGIGKSRLLEEASTLAILEGVNVQVVRCQPHYVHRPMGVFIELVPALLTCRGALGVDPELLDHLQLLTKHSDNRANRPADERDNATRAGILLAAVRDLVDAVSAEAPLLVAVEDGHWADPTSLQELSTLVRGGTSRSLLVVHTARTLEPLKQASILTDAVQVVKLKPIVEAPMLAMARHLLQRSTEVDGRDLAAWCASTAGGNPLYLQALCAHYDDTKEAFVVPPSLRAATVRRLEQLPEDCRRLLEFSVLLGRHATLDSLRSLTQLPSLAFLKAVQRIEEEGFVRLRDGAARLSHDMLADSVLELVAPLSRSALHSCVADLLERRYDSDGDAALIWACAQHRIASGDSSAAIRAAARCSRHSVDLGQAALALELLSRVSALAAGKRDQMALLEEQAIVARACGRHHEVVEATRRLAELDPDEHGPDSAWGFRLLESLWTSATDSGGSVERLMSHARTIDLPAERRTDAANLLVRIAHERGDYALAADAYDAVRGILDSESLCYSNRMLPILFHVSFGDATAAANHSSQLLADLPRFEVASQLRAARNVSVALHHLGRTRAAFDLSQSYFERSKRLGLTHWQRDFANICCICLVDDEDLPAALEWYASFERLRVDASAVLDFTHFSSGVEIGIATRNESLANSALASLNQIHEGESVRIRAVALALTVRVAQLNPTYRVPVEHVAALRESLRKPRRLSGADAAAIAIAEDLKRGGQDAATFVKQYLESGRQDVAEPPSALLTFVESPETITRDT